MKCSTIPEPPPARRSWPPTPPPPIFLGDPIVFDRHRRLFSLAGEFRQIMTKLNKRMDDIDGRLTALQKEKENHSWNPDTQVFTTEDKHEGIVIRLEELLRNSRGKKSLAILLGSSRMRNN